MTDKQIAMCIMQNDSRGWRYICRNMKPGFTAILAKSYNFGPSVNADIEDIFQDSCLVLMEKIKEGKFAISGENSVFKFLVQIGKNNARNFLRKRRTLTPEDEVIVTINMHNDDQDVEMSLEKKQKSQNEFLDRVFESIPSECQTILKRFYWERKPMDEIASTMGLRNADSAKTKKNRCMNKFKEIAKMLLESDEFAEEAVRATVERAALKELLEEERVYSEMADTAIAAYEVDDVDWEKLLEENPGLEK